MPKEHDRIGEALELMRYWKKLPREAGDTPPLQVLKVRLEGL